MTVSRGAIIDQVALEQPEVHLRLGGIALDVFENEPLPMASALRKIPQAILTPHEISHTRENLSALFERAKTNIADVLAGRMPATALNDLALTG